MGVGVWVATSSSALMTDGKVTIAEASADALKVDGGIDAGGVIQAGSGNVNLTNSTGNLLPASIASGTVSNALTFGAGLTAGNSIIAAFNGANVIIDNTAGSANNRKFLIQSSGTSLGISAISDDLLTVSSGISITRSGNQVTGMTLGPASGATSGYTFQGGRINTNTSQPGFLARKVNDQASSNGTVTVVFEAESYDNTSAYASNTFTAPSAGQYLITSTVLTDGVTGADVHFAFSVNDAITFGTIATGANSGSVVVALAAGETVWVEVSATAVGTIGSKSTFCARLMV